jgi:hypothetical protein
LTAISRALPSSSSQNVQPPTTGAGASRPVQPAEHLAIARELLGDDLPRLLRDDEDADAEARHDVDRLRRHGRRVRAVAEALERPRADRATDLLHVLAVELRDAGLERGQQQLRGLDEDLAALVHVDAEAFELDAAEPATQAEHDAAVRHVVEHRHLLGDADRVVPRQDDDHRAELHRVRAAGEVRQVLQHVRAHRVVGEVMLDSPDRLEAELLGEDAEPQLPLVDLAVAAIRIGALEDQRGADVHAPALRPERARRQVTGRDEVGGHSAGAGSRTTGLLVVVVASPS